LTHERSSSFPSRIVVTTTTLVFGIMTAFQEENRFSWTAIIFTTLAAYVVTSFARIHLGSCYPSDCLASLPLILIVLGLSLLLWYIDKFFGCETC
jgi:hypothetical protein